LVATAANFASIAIFWQAAASLPMPAVPRKGISHHLQVSITPLVGLQATTPNHVKCPHMTDLCCDRCTGLTPRQGTASSYCAAQAQRMTGKTCVTGSSFTRTTHECAMCLDGVCAH
jgi:hypothetical protein